MEAENNDFIRKPSKAGYRKPPEHTRFKAGQSGNAKGRPKGALNMATVLERTLRERMVISENGKQRTVTKLEAALTQLANKAAAGDLKALQFLAALVRSSEERAIHTPETVLNDVDHKVMLGILNRIEGASSKGEKEDADKTVIK
jgi:hypothetical protein